MTTPSNSPYTPDLRGFIAFLEKEHPEQVVRISREVDPKFGVSGILERLERDGKFPLVIFENVKGSTIPLVAKKHLFLHRRARHHHWVDRMGLTRRAFLDEGFDIAVFHAKAESQPLEARMHVGDQWNLRTLHVVEDDQREAAVPLQPFKDARDPELRIDLLAHANDLLGMLRLEIRDEPAQVGRVGRIGQPVHFPCSCVPKWRLISDADPADPEQV